MGVIDVAVVEIMKEYGYSVKQRKIAFLAVNYIVLCVIYFGVIV